MLSKVYNRKRIHSRIRKKIKGTSDIPRLAIYKSNKKICCQLIDDINAITLASASSSDKDIKKGTKTEQASEVGILIAKKAKSEGISKVVFDRGGFLYHGRIKALADQARKEGLDF